MRPYLKWAGGKQRSLPHLKPLLEGLLKSEQADAYAEPFCGSCAVALNLTLPPQVYLSDINADLITLHRGVVSPSSPTFVARLRQWFDAATNTASFYAWARRYYNTLDTAEARAPILLYLNRHAYNGLMRYNSRGEFNAPFGSYKRPHFPVFEMECFRDRFANASINTVSVFHMATHAATMPKRTLWYFDPPYLTPDDLDRERRSPMFTRYWDADFTAHDHAELHGLAIRLQRMGHAVAISNDDNEATRTLYRDADAIHTYPVLRSVSCKADGRTEKQEILAVYA